MTIERASERMTAMDDLAAFIEARLAEDEAIALAARDGERLPWQDDEWNDQPGEWTAHIARHDPARVLREAAAKRAIVARYAEAQSWSYPPGDGDEAVQDALAMVIRHLAAIWSDHGDYRTEWAPS